MINLIRAFIKATKAGWQHYKNMKYMRYYVNKYHHKSTNTQGKEAIERTEWISDVARYVPLGSDASLYNLYDFIKENDISKEETINTILIGVDVERIVTALDWMLYVAKYSPLSVSDIISSGLYMFAQVNGHSKGDIINIACKGWDSEHIIRILNKGYGR